MNIRPILIWTFLLFYGTCNVCTEWIDDFLRQRFLRGLFMKTDLPVFVFDDMIRKCFSGCDIAAIEIPRHDIAGEVEQLIPALCKKRVSERISLGK